MTTGQHKTLVLPPPYRNAVVVIAIAIGMAAIFATSYSLGLKFRDWLAAIAVLAIAAAWCWPSWWIL